MLTDMYVSGLFCYPMKSCGGVEVTDAWVDRRGFLFDRLWMVVDERGVFVTQRQIPTMALIKPQIIGDRLILRAPDMAPLLLLLEGEDGPRRNIEVWRSPCLGIDQGNFAARWFTEFLSRTKCGKYRLLRFDEEYQRRTTTGDAELAFGDGYSFLVASEASLADLNARLNTPIPMDRFRPNIVLGGGGPYVEDRIGLMQIRNVRFAGMTQCARCNIIKTDQETAKLGNEPFDVLRTYRDTEKGPVFGRNFNHLNTGDIHLGDRVTVLALA